MVMERPVPDDMAPPNDLTVRAVGGGLIVGTLLCCTNLYLGLQSAFITMASMQAALVGFGLLRCLTEGTQRGQIVRTRMEERAERHYRRSLRWIRTPFSAQENAVLQATAVSLGAMPLCAGLIGIVPAFNLLSPAKDGRDVQPFTFSWPALLVWCASMAYFGIFFASPMRKPMIIQEKLRFPSGSATAQLIALLHGETLREEEKKTQTVNDSDISEDQQHLVGQAERQPLLHRNTSWIEREQEVEKGWPMLLITFFASGAVTLGSFAFPVLYAIPIFDLIVPCHNAAAQWGWWLTPSLSYVGQGIIMGPHTTFSMFTGAITGWAILSPLVHHFGWTNGVPTDAENGSQAWLLWVALAIMTSESVVGLATLSVAHHLSRKNDRTVVTSSGDVEPRQRLIPRRWIVGGFVLSTLTATLLLHALFRESTNVRIWVPSAGVVLAGLLSVLAVRALGATDLNPVNALGKLSQLVFAILQPGNIVANMVGGALSEAGAMQAGELMQDYKTGHLLCASPRSLFFGQIFGSTAGIFVATTAYKLYEHSYNLPGPEMPAPAARLWLNFARLINTGSLPPHAGPAMVIAGVLFACSTFVKTLQEHDQLRASVPRWASWLPNGVAFAVGLGLNSPNYSFARLIGGLIVLYVKTRASKQRRDQTRSDGQTSLPPVKLLIWSAGFVLGEGFASILLLFLKQAGLGPISCWGCRGGCSGGC